MAPVQQAKDWHFEQEPHSPSVDHTEEPIHISTVVQAEGNTGLWPKGIDRGTNAPLPPPSNILTSYPQLTATLYWKMTDVGFSVGGDVAPLM